MRRLGGKFITVPAIPSNRAKGNSFHKKVTAERRRQRLDRQHKNLHDSFVSDIKELAKGIVPEYRLDKNGVHRPFGKAKLGDFVYDFAWPQYKVAVELQGGIYRRGRNTGHVSISGMERDMEKLNRAAVYGWILLQFSPHKVYDRPNYVYQTLKAVMAYRTEGMSR